MSCITISVYRQTLLEAFISTRLDYCNSVYSIHRQLVPTRIRAVQNAATRLVTGARRSEHAHHASFEAASLITVQAESGFQAGCADVQSTAPPYLAEDCQLVATTDRRQLQSSAHNIVIFL